MTGPTIPHTIPDPPVQRNFEVLNASNVSISSNVDAISNSVSSISSRQLAEQYYFASPQPGIAEWNVGTNYVSAVVTSKLYMAPIILPTPVSVDSYAVAMGPFASTSNSIGSYALYMGVYTATGSTLSSIVTSSYQRTWSSGTNASSNWGGASGIRKVNAPFASSFSPGHYWIGWQLRSVHAAYGVPLAWGDVGAGLRADFAIGGASSAAPFGMGDVGSNMAGNASINAVGITAHTDPWFVPRLYFYNTSIMPW